MKQLRYLDWLYQMFDIYKEDEILEAYEFATKNAKYVSGSLAGIYLYRIMLAFELKNTELGLSLIKEAVLEHGFWYSYDMFTKSDMFIPIKDNKAFKDICDIIKVREEEQVLTRSPYVEVFKPKEDKLKKPKLHINLHGDQQEVEAVHDYWNPESFFDYIVAIPVSSVLSYSDGPTWNDIDRGVWELKQHYDNLIRQYSINKNDVVLSAFSGGTTVALTAILKEVIQVNKLVLVAPPIQNWEEIKGLLPVLKKTNTSVYILCGDNDDRFLPVATKLAEALKDLDVKYMFNIAKDTGHEYPSNFEEVLKEIKHFFEI